MAWRKKSIDVPEDNLQNILNDLVENTKELKNKELSEHLEDLKDNINEIGKDIICPVLNLFDDDGLTENIKVRRMQEVQELPRAEHVAHGQFVLEMINMPIAPQQYCCGAIVYRWQGMLMVDLPCRGAAWMTIRCFSPSRRLPSARGGLLFPRLR